MAARGAPRKGFCSASEHSSPIIEYVQRFGDFQGFFTKDSVARLTPCRRRGGGVAGNGCGGAGGGGGFAGVA